MSSAAARLHQAARLRGAALAQLWLHRGTWRLPLPRALMRRERDTQLADLMPAVIVIALMVGALMFITLPGALGDSYLGAMATLWPAWVVQAAPIAAAQVLAMQRAPTLALELSQRHEAGEFAALEQLGASAAAWPCVPLLAAHAMVTVAASFLLIALTLALGLGGAFVLAVGGLRETIDLLFALVSPLAWLRSALAAAALGLAASLATMLFAWPGTQRAVAGADAHRLGLRAMAVSAVAVIAAALAFNWVMNLLAFVFPG
jgi:hypothetical protein